MNRTRPDASQQVTNVAELRHVTDVLKLPTPLAADDSSSENLLKTIPAMTPVRRATRGGGGSNFTGSYSGTGSCALTRQLTTSLTVSQDE